MAELDFILQAVTTANHADAIRALLGITNPDRVLISVAFVRTPGLDVVGSAIKPHAAKSKFFVGIRNDITSVQAIKRLLAMKVDLYAVDTGSRNTIFHPKFYLAANAKMARVIIGSANLTFGGMHNNIEASTLMKLDLANTADKKFVDEAIKTFGAMLKNHPRHVFAIKDDKHADELFETGRLVDETVIPAPSTTRSVKKGERDDLPPMKLNHVPFPKIKLLRAKTTVAARPAKTPTVGAREGVPATPITAATVIGFNLVWESKELKERDLNVPTGKNTNPTGSMLLKKGAVENIDQRHFFRDEVFKPIIWISDSSKPHLERSEASFELVIKNLNYGKFKLKLTHNTNKKSKAYQQNNAMTSLHWGQVKELIAKRDLLGRILYLYRKDTDPPEYMIEID
jgi:HKD family nuclease